MAPREYEVYIGYLDGKDEEIDAHREIVVEVRDLETFERKVVRAVLARPGQELPDSDILWVTDWVESSSKEEWKIKVVEELDEDTDVARERSDISEEDLTKQSKEAAKFSQRRYTEGLFTGGGDEEAKKYFIYKTKIEKGKAPR